MNLSLYIAKRYIFSKKSHQVINIISGVAIFGVALATAAMVCALSVFNGFRTVVAEQFTAMEPDIKVTATLGKGFCVDSPSVVQATQLPQLSVVSFCVEDRAMVQYGGKQVMVPDHVTDHAFIT